MRKREELHREFASTAPYQTDDKVLVVDQEYKRGKVMLEAMLDVRELLERLLLKQELQEKKALLLEGSLSGMGEME